ncbi:putative ribosomal protein L2, domain 2 [Helianthus annuus]|uniref:Putative plastid transcriptionally active 13 n=1 Tax=Helianthus annuus TaxID=4232 RepID=A0A251TLC1_HELAN|nr:transcription termination/antitermination protein NusG [Helianthus annuus]KAF5785653.1 putative ribosomal protein L2, domain 2 [Helianthus annuus]KAJ0513177.1 putative ribosomal protein L2, domain 2 [Helianthus annuus]KAJ0520935.1 putative ribosomal protein L2, domain 2 [Helianthus annuus]KAJ0529301.1 putative ribosomal protein L2, domain 2 [Helianthus annuus]KAJ0696183.1 putative ribosomal protein L2, domain 2 [Helianthus annuus]
MMNQELLSLSWRPLYVPISVAVGKPSPFLLRATTTSLVLTPKEKRDLRNLKRDEKRSYNWREDVEEKLLQKPKKQFNSWKEELNLDKLSELGPQWWILKVSRARGKDTVERMLQALHKNYPDVEFKVFDAAVYEKSKLKNGKISVKPKPLYPGCVFIHCILNRELHNFIREDCEGVGGFVGRMVGNTKRQINKPRPVSKDDMESIFEEVKEKQEAADRAFEEEQASSVSPSVKKTSDKTKSRKRTLLGSTVRIVSGDFVDFSGTVKKLDKKRGLATVGFTLFGKETIADLNLSEIVQEQK